MKPPVPCLAPDCEARFRPPHRGLRKYCSEACSLRVKALRKVEWRKNNPEKARAYRAKYLEKNGDEVRKRTRDWQQANPEVILAGKLRRYGLTIASYEELLSAQGGACAICRTDDPGARRWHVDHDHACCPAKGSCGRCVRGLLCSRCNVGLGNFRDTPSILRAASDYLTRVRT